MQSLDKTLKGKMKKKVTSLFHYQMRSTLLESEVHHTFSLMKILKLNHQLDVLVVEYHIGTQCYVLLLTLSFNIFLLSYNTFLSYLDLQLFA